ncbi:BTAD domain-containing putative transcriptional regulator [Spirillospora sp. NPDC127200]
MELLESLPAQVGVIGSVGLAAALMAWRLTRQAGFAAIGGTALRRCLQLFHHSSGSVPGRERASTATVQEPALEAAVVALGLRQGRPVMVDLAATGGLRLVGAGAEEAERALLVELITAAQAGRMQVITARADLEWLLGHQHLAVVGGINGLHVADNIAEALEHLAAQIIERTRLTEDGVLPAVATDSKRSTPLVCLLAPGRHTEQLHADLRLGNALGVGAVLLGDWPHGTTLAVDGGGLVLDGTGPAATHLIGTQLARWDQGAALARIAGLNPPSPAPATMPTTKPDLATVPGTVRLLGNCRLDGPGGPVTFRKNDAWALLALLVEHREQLVTRAVIEDKLWPGEDISDAKFNSLLRDTRARLCEALGRPSRQGRLMIRYIAPHGYQLNRELFTCDVWQLRDWASRTVTTGDPSETAGLAALVDLYTGPYLPDHGALPWAQNTARGITRIVVDALTRLASGENEPTRALVHLERACEIEPTAEHLYRQRMQHYTALGRVTAVHHCYDQLTEELAKAGHQPDARTKQLYRRLTVEE